MPKGIPKPKVIPKDKWISLPCENHMIIERINTLEAEGYEVFTIAPIPKGINDFLIIGKLK